jgi:hypothetical protein
MQKGFCPWPRSCEQRRGSTAPSEVSYVIPKIRRFFLIAVLIELGAIPNGRAQLYSCNPDPPSPDYKTLKLSAQTNPVALVSRSLQYKNDDHVWIVVTDINPFVAIYTLNLKRQPVTESGIGIFLSALGGIDAGIVPAQKSPSQSPSDAKAPSSGPTPTPAGAACDSTPLEQLAAKFNLLEEKEKKINTALNAISARYAADSKSFKDLPGAVKGEHLCAGIQNSAGALRQFLAAAATEFPDQLKPAEAGEYPSADDPTKVLKGIIDQLTQDAKAQRRVILDYRKSTAGKPLCASFLNAKAKLLDDEDDFIDGLGLPNRQFVC